MVLPPNPTMGRWSKGIPFQQAGRLAGDHTQASAGQLEGSVELHLHGLVEPFDLPGIRSPEPVGCSSCQPSLMDWTENAVFITKTVAHGGELHRGQRVEKASRQAPESPIAETGIGLPFEKFDGVDFLLFNELLHNRIQ